MDKELLGWLVELNAMVVVNELEQFLNVFCCEYQEVLQLERRAITLA